MILALKDAARLSSQAMPSRVDIAHQMAEIRTIWTVKERKRRAEMGLLLQLRLLAKCGAISAEDESPIS